MRKAVIQRLDTPFISCDETMRGLLLYHRSSIQYILGELVALTSYEVYCEAGLYTKIRCLAL